jgi:hypothetical protein
MFHDIKLIVVYLDKGCFYKNHMLIIDLNNSEYSVSFL